MTPASDTDRIRIRTLGAMDVRSTGQGADRTIALPAKPMALLAYLVVATPRGLHRRDTVLGLLWPELAPARARHALRQALYTLRKSIGSDVVVSRHDEIGLDGDRVWCDAVAFEVSLDEGRYADALELYRGELLPGLFIADAAAFEHWLDRERARLRRRAADAAWTLVEHAEERERFPLAAERARHALELSPYDEARLRRLLALLDRVGDRSGAVRAYDRFATRLAADLEVEPAPETTALLRKIRRRTSARPKGRGEDDRHDARRARSASGAETHEPDVVPDAGAARERWPWTPARSAAVLGVVAVMVVGAALMVFGRDDGGAEWTASDSNRVVVDVFDNRTGEPSLDPLGRVAADWISRGLERTGMFEVVPSLPAMATVRDVAADAPDAAGLDRLRRLAEATGAGVVISGTYYVRGDSLRIHAQAVDATERRLLRAIEPVIGARDEPTRAIAVVRQRVLAALAVGVDPLLEGSIETWGLPPSFEAYQEWTEGVAATLRSDLRTALSYFERASDRDSSFTGAILWASIANINLGRYATADSLLRRIGGSIDRLTPGQRHFYRWQRALLTGDFEDVLRTTRERAKYQVGSGIGRYDLALFLLRLNRVAEALDTLRLIDPDRGLMRDSHWYARALTEGLHRLGDHEAELNAARRARERFPDRVVTLALEARALAALGQIEQVERIIDRSAALPPGATGTPGTLMLRTALELRAHGHAGAARAAFERTLDWYRRRPPAVRRTTPHRYHYAVAAYYAGRWEEAEPLFRALAAAEPHRVAYRGYVGLIAARRARETGAAAAREEAGRIADALAVIDEPYLFGRHTLFRARIAAVLGHRERAVTRLREALAQRRGHSLSYHRQPDFDSLRDYPPFREFMRPE